MTIIVAFILDAFVFRMNYSRKNREPEGDPEGEWDCGGVGVCARVRGYGCVCVCLCVRMCAAQSMVDD